MESVGTVIKILTPESGTGQKSGKQWTSQGFVIEVRSGEHGQYTRKQVFKLFGEDDIRKAQLFEGKQVRVSFDIDAHEHNGKWFPDIRVWRVEQVGAQIPTQPYVQPAPQPQYPPQPQPQQFASQPQYPPQPQGGYQQAGGYYPPQPPTPGEALPF